MATDLVVRGGRVVTVDDALPFASAVAVEAGRIVAVGVDDDIDGLIGPGTEVIEAQGRSVLPGFVDAHNHVRLGSNPTAVPLFGRTSLEAIRARLAEHAASMPDHAWVEGEGWNYAAVPGGRPTAAMLEGVTGEPPRVPVLLRRPHGVDEPARRWLVSGSRATPSGCRGAGWSTTRPPGHRRVS